MKNIKQQLINEVQNNLLIENPIRSEANAYQRAEQIVGIYIEELLREKLVKDLALDIFANFRE